MVIIYITIQLSWAIHRHRRRKVSIENNENCNVASTDLKWLKEKQLTGHQQWAIVQELCLAHNEASRRRRQ